MNPNSLIFQPDSKIIVATNTFINVPVILKYENINLIEVIKESQFEYTTQIPIFHADGTSLAVAKGSRIYKTKEGEKAGVEIKQYPNLWVCVQDGKTLFEIRQQPGDFFKTTAELYANDGFFIKTTDETPIGLFNNEEPLKIGGLTMKNCTFRGCKTGIWVKKDSGILIGSNL